MFSASSSRRNSVSRSSSPGNYKRLSRNSHALPELDHRDSYLLEKRAAGLPGVPPTQTPHSEQRALAGARLWLPPQLSDGEQPHHDGSFCPAAGGAVKDFKLNCKQSDQ
jgi:hypothetical protein